MLRTAVLRNVTTPIIMFTSGAGTDVDLATVRAGAADYLLKTELSPSLLSRTIRYAIERSRLLNEMRSLARHDHLTGLLTRREMDRVLDEELVRSHRYGHPVALDPPRPRSLQAGQRHLRSRLGRRRAALGRLGRQSMRPRHRPRRALRRGRTGHPAARDRPGRRLRPGRADPRQGRRDRDRAAAGRVGHHRDDSRSRSASVSRRCQGRRPPRPPSSSPGPTPPSTRPSGAAGTRSSAPATPLGRAAARPHGPASTLQRERERVDIPAGFRPGSSPGPAAAAGLAPAP